MISSSYINGEAPLRYRNKVQTLLNSISQKYARNEPVNEALSSNSCLNNSRANDPRKRQGVVEAPPSMFDGFDDSPLNEVVLMESKAQKSIKNEIIPLKSCMKYNLANDSKNRSIEAPPSMFDDFDDSPLNLILGLREPPVKKKRVSFHADVVDPIPSREEPSHTVSIPYNENHAPVDYFVPKPETYENSHLLELPNQSHPIGAPLRQAFENWPRLDRINAEYSFDTFHYNSFYKKFQGQRPYNLIIHDSILDTVNIIEKFRRTERLRVGYPNDPWDIIKYLENEVKANTNDFVINKIFICMGLDFVCHFPNLEHLPTFITTFLQHFGEQIRKTFARDGPPRYRPAPAPRSISPGEFEVINEDNYSFTSFDVSIPQFIIITVPYIQQSMHPTCSHEIAQLNTALREFVESNKEQWAKNYDHDIELYDWEQESRNFPECNADDLEGRYRVLHKALANKYQVFMHK